MCVVKEVHIALCVRACVRGSTTVCVCVCVCVVQEVHIACVCRGGARGGIVMRVKLKYLRSFFVTFELHRIYVIYVCVCVCVLQE